MVETGLAVLLREYLHLLKDQRIGLVSHAAAITSDLQTSQDALLSAGVRLQALFGPEHGFSGSAPDGSAVEHYIDSETGLTIFSLYGLQKEPDRMMLEQIDLLVFDMQDVGVRFYTYLSTLYYVIKGAAKAGCPVLVLDRPNPLAGLVVEGPCLEQGYESFVGVMAGLPIRHGMTLGELASYLNRASNLGAALQVIPMQGWNRSTWFSETGLPWAPTSPAMPHLSTTLVYPGMCLLEGTNISEGRGTALPFEICGAPWIQGKALASALNQLELPGVRFRPVSFTPTASKYSGQVCQGAQVYVTQRDLFRSVQLGFAVIQMVKSLYPHHFQWNESFDRLAGSSAPRQILENNRSLNEWPAGWQTGEQAFYQCRVPYLLYS